MKHVNLVVADGDRNTLGKYVSELRRMDGINVVGQRRMARSCWRYCPMYVPT